MTNRMQHPYLKGSVGVGEFRNGFVASVLTRSPFCPQMPTDGEFHRVTVTGSDSFIGIHLDEQQIGGYINYEDEITEEEVVSLLLSFIGMARDTDG